MWVEITSKNRKAIKNLVSFAKGNGWDVTHVISNIDDGEKYLEIETEELFVDCHTIDMDKSEKIDIKRARKLLSREILRVSDEDFGVVKSEKGVKIGCTFIKEDVAKQILARIKPLPQIGDNDVQIDEENKMVRLGYNRLTYDEIEEVAEFMGWAE